jgi:hypothetical protein
VQQPECSNDPKNPDGRTITAVIRRSLTITGKKTKFATTKNARLTNVIAASKFVPAWKSGGQ